MTQTALVVGASGIVGSAITQLLLDNDWQVAALSRSPSARPGVIPVAADLQNPESVRAALADVKPTHVFITTWSRQATEAENIRVNAAMVRNVLDAVRPAGSVKHVALVTGLKHYLGPFEAYGKGTLPQTPFRESQARLDIENFYYAQEDEVFAAAEGWLYLERPSPAHRDRCCRRQRDEHGDDPGRLRLDLQSHGPTFRVPGLTRAVGQPDRHDRCAAAGPPATVGSNHTCSGQSGVQHHQWRCVSLELDVGTDRRILRLAASRFPQRASPAGNADGQRSGGLG